jgi:preprotein translocase subunit SecD
MNNFRVTLAAIVFLLTVFCALVVFSDNLSFVPDNLKVKMKKGLDIQGGMHLVLEAHSSDKLNIDSLSKEDLHNAMVGVKTVIENRVNGTGVSEPLIQIKGDRQVIVELPGIKDPEKAIKLLGDTAQLSFMEHAPGGMLIDSGLSGAELKKAMAGFDTTGKSVVNVEFNDIGKKKFGELSTKLVGKPLAIILDGKVISDPIIQEPILGGQAQISGNFSPEEAQTLAIQLNAGALPLPVEVVEKRTVGATLGAESVDKSIKAGLLGFGLVIMFMIAYYRLPGTLAGVALLSYSLFSLAIFFLIPVVLTLPGIAGFILSIGMAVDANVLIFERLKEELKAGNTIYASIDRGFNRAFSAIFDSNMTTWIACAILFYFGTGLIKGFALTLAIGVAVSMFSAITITKTLMHLVLGVGEVKNPALFGLKAADIQTQPQQETLSARRKKNKGN